MKNLIKVLFICLMLLTSFGCLSQKDMEKEENLSTVEKEYNQESQDTKATKASYSLSGLKVIKQSKGSVTIQWTINSKIANAGYVKYYASDVNEWQSTVGYYWFGMIHDRNQQKVEYTIPLQVSRVYYIGLSAQTIFGDYLGISDTIRVDNR